jgi:hypothetical protein
MSRTDSRGSFLQENKTFLSKLARRAREKSGRGKLK